MNIARYCRDLGMDLQGFKAFEQSIKDEAQAIYDKAKVIRPQGTGMYFPTSELIELKEEKDYFVIDELRSLGVEFLDNLTLYRA